MHHRVGDLVRTADALQEDGIDLRLLGLGGIGSSLNQSRSIGVSISPGQTAFTRIPSGARSIASARSG